MAAITTGGSGNWSSTVNNTPWVGGVVPVEGDTVTIANTHIVTIDQNVTVGADNATAALDVLSGGTLAVSNPAASYTLICKGDFMVRSGGTLTIDMSTQPNYTFTSKINYSAVLVNAKYVFKAFNGSTVTITGASKTRSYDTLSSQAASGQAHIITTNNNSTNWLATDTVIVLSSLAATTRASQIENKVISSFSATDITLTGNLTNTHAAGVYVTNLTRNVVMTDYDVSKPSQYNFLTSNNTKNTQVWVEYRGTYLKCSSLGGTYGNCSYNGSDNNIYYPLYVDSASTSTASGHTFTNCVFHAGASACVLLRRACNFQSCIITNSNTAGGIYAINNVNGLTINNCFLQVKGATSLGAIGFAAESGSPPFNTTITNNTIDGNSFYGIFVGVGIIKMTCSNNTIQYCVKGYNLMGNILFASTSDNLLNNTSDLYIEGFNQAIFTNTNFQSSTQVTIGTLISGGYVAIQSIGGAGSNQHKYYQLEGVLSSVGSGLADITVHTAGGLDIRFEPASSVTNLSWQFTIPTGNIQNKTMMVGVWCYINSATYYAGTHQLPRLTIDYDNGTAAYVQASASAGSWQFLSLPFTPTSTYGQITVTLSARTDATTTNAYVYFDDFVCSYPPNSSLDLGAMDNWAQALPVVPPIAIPISSGTVASAVWESLKTTHTTTGTMGKALGGLKNPSIILDGEIIG